MISTLPDQNFDPTIAQKRLAKYFDVISTAIFGDISLVEECAIGALISYLEITQFNDAPILTLPKRDPPDLPFEKSLPSNNLFIDRGGMIIKGFK